MVAMACTVSCGSPRRHTGPMASDPARRRRAAPVAGGGRGQRPRGRRCWPAALGRGPRRPTPPRTGVGWTTSSTTAPRSTAPTTADRLHAGAGGDVGTVARWASHRHSVLGRPRHGGGEPGRRGVRGAAGPGPARRRPWHGWSTATVRPPWPSTCPRGSPLWPPTAPTSMPPPTRRCTPTTAPAATRTGSGICRRSARRTRSGQDLVSLVAAGGQLFVSVTRGRHGHRVPHRSHLVGRTPVGGVGAGGGGGR